MGPDYVSAGSGDYFPTGQVFRYCTASSVSPLSVPELNFQEPPSQNKANSLAVVSPKLLFPFKNPIPPTSSGTWLCQTLAKSGIPTEFCSTFEYESLLQEKSHYFQ